jgi:hypothetical protein
MAKKRQSSGKTGTKKGFLNGIQAPKGSITDSLLSTLAMLIVGGGVGGAIGAAIGRHSLLAGIPVIVGGNYMGNLFVTSLGIGISLANGYQAMPASDTQTAGFGDLEGMSVEEAKGRAATYLSNFSQKLYLDKVLSPKAVSGLGYPDPSVTYLVYPQETGGLTGAEVVDVNTMSVAELDRYIAQADAELARRGTPVGMLTSDTLY